MFGIDRIIVDQECEVNDEIKMGNNEYNFEEKKMGKYLNWMLIKKGGCIVSIMLNSRLGIRG